jgi:nucleoid-associated protein YgaU
MPKAWRVSVAIAIVSCTFCACHQSKNNDFQKAAPAKGAVIDRYLVKKGDTLSSIAKKYYGKSSKWREIVAANEDLLESSADLTVGQTLIIPKVSQ